jgi:hypothetical protein
MLGGQAVNSIVGAFCRFYSSGARPHRLVYGTASDLLADQQANDALRTRKGHNTIIHVYDEIALSRWVERTVAAAGIVTLLGATVRNVICHDRRIGPVITTNRHGDVLVDAQHYIDASGDPVLSTAAAHACDLAESGPVHTINLAALRERLRENMEAADLVFEHEEIVAG